MRLRNWYCVGVALLLPLVIGCSQYVGDVSFVPRPAVADIPPTPPQQNPPVSSMASVIGVRYEDPADEIPSSIEVRLRVDNNGPGSVVFSPTEMELSNGELQRFPPPIIRPPDPVQLPVGQSAYVTAYFPFPPGHSYYDTDYSSLQLRWRVQVDGKIVGQGAYFRREYATYYDYGPYPYYSYPSYGFVGGVVVVHRR
ncbi:MAG: hypothetical protein ABSB74_03460 [Tepidisphaeraceae bacterium]